MDTLSSALKHQITPRDALSGTTSNDVRSPGAGGTAAKRNLPITMDDLDQDFAFEIFESFQLGKELKEDVMRLKLAES